MTFSAPFARSGALVSRLRLSEYGWGRRIALVLAALVGSAAMAYAANLAGRNLLLQVARVCALDKSTTGSPLPCLEVDTASGFAVLRPPFGRRDTILTPLIAIRGLEDAQLQAPGAPNYFALAYDARRWAVPASARVALAVNSRLARSQDQLHIHMGCLSEDFVSRLSNNALGPRAAEWFRASDMAPGLELWTYRGGRDIAALAPFRLLKSLLGDPKSLARTTLAVVETPAEFIVVAMRSQPGGWYSAAEDVVDERC